MNRSASALLVLVASAASAADRAPCSFVLGSYPTPPGVNTTSAAVGATVRVSVLMGKSRNEVMLERFRFELDCEQRAAGIGCPDAGEGLEYLGDGTITTTCTADGNPVAWSTGHPGGFLPNEVVFTAKPAFRLPTAQERRTCTVEFDVKAKRLPAVTYVGLKSGANDASCVAGGEAGTNGPSLWVSEKK